MQYFYYHSNDSLNDDISMYATLNCKGSKFLAFLYQLPQVTQDTKKIDSNSKIQQQKDDYIESHNTLRNAWLDELRAIHKKAVHFVWAFRILNEYNHIIEGSSDDGEPKGSAGMPMLEVLRGKCLVNTLCICVRYFGGTKLGVGGLVRAYTQATLQTIDYAYTKGYILAYKKQSEITIHDKSSAYNKILHLAKKHQLTITHKEFLQANISIQLQGEAENIANFLKEKTSM